MATGILYSSGGKDGIDVEVELAADNASAIEKKLASGYFKGLKKIGLRAQTYAKRKCPIDTGRLRNSITYRVSGDEAYIGSNVEYAPYVECGTGSQSTVGGNPLIHGQRPQPFLKPAATEHASEYGDILKEEVSKQ